MQLNKFTDYALRILMYVASPRKQPYTITELAAQLHISENHVMKIVHFMAKQQWLMTTRGKGGGIRLNPSSLELNLGDLVRILQKDQSVVECHNPPCILRQKCGLKGIVDQALEQFYLTLNQYQLGDVISSDTHQYTQLSPIQLINLHEAASK